MSPFRLVAIVAATLAFGLMVLALIEAFPLIAVIGYLIWSLCLSDGKIERGMFWGPLLWIGTNLFMGLVKIGWVKTTPPNQPTMASTLLTGMIFPKTPWVEQPVDVDQEELAALRRN